MLVLWELGQSARDGLGESRTGISRAELGGNGAQRLAGVGCEGCESGNGGRAAGGVVFVVQVEGGVGDCRLSRRARYAVVEDRETLRG